VPSLSDRVMMIRSSLFADFNCGNLSVSFGSVVTEQKSKMSASAPADSYAPAGMSSPTTWSRRLPWLLEAGRDAAWPWER